MTDYELARGLVARFHAGQTYGEDPYTYHLDMVEASIKAAGLLDNRLPVIAQLHDILEDTECTEEFLRAIFDKDIVDAVVALTFLHGNLAETKDEYLIRCRSNGLAKTVKMHDTFCNLSESLKRQDVKRIVKYGKQLAVLAA